MGMDLAKSSIAKALMILIHHSFVEALLHDQLAQNRQVVTNTVYKVRSFRTSCSCSIGPGHGRRLPVQVSPSRIVASMRQPAFLVHVADTIGPLAEKVCEQLVAHGRLDFNGIVSHMLAESQQGQDEDPPDAEKMKQVCGEVVIKLLRQRLIEQVR
jgi:hypothetical protein